MTESSTVFVTRNCPGGHRRIVCLSAITLAALTAVVAQPACSGEDDASGRSALTSASGAGDSGVDATKIRDSRGTGDANENSRGTGGAPGDANAGTGGRSQAGAPSAGGASSGDAACRDIAYNCSADSDCCTGYCTPDLVTPDASPGVPKACQTPGCSHFVEPCKDSFDCCVMPGVGCSGGLCVYFSH